MKVLGCHLTILSRDAKQDKGESTLEQPRTMPDNAPKKR